MRTRRGQAMMELAVGMFSLALVLSALFAFTDYIVKSLEMQRSLRAEAGRKAFGSRGGETTASARDVLELRPFAVDFIFGSQTIAIQEAVSITNMQISP